MAYYAGSSHYSATKKFIDYLSQSVAFECSDKIDILTARPYIVSTSMTKNIESFITTTTNKCVKNIVDALGNRPYCYGPFLHNIQGVGSEFLY